LDLAKIEAAVASIIKALGEDPTREGLIGTPHRVAEMYQELFSGLDMDPARELEVGFEEGFHEMVILRDIPFYSVCEHHFLPFFGVAHIGYMPNGRVVGASKIARALEILAKRPQIQERLTAQMADLIQQTLRPQGVAVVIRAEHLCISMRGVRKPGTLIVTSATKGKFEASAATRSEFLALVQGRE